MKTPRFVMKLNGQTFGPEPEYFWLSAKVEVMVWQDERLHVVSSVCPHMGARLVWNRARREYQCPWHGLTFSQETCRGTHHRYGRIKAFDAEIVDDELRVYD